MAGRKFGQPEFRPLRARSGAMFNSFGSDSAGKANLGRFRPDAPGWAGTSGFDLPAEIRPLTPSHRRAVVTSLPCANVPLYFRENEGHRRQAGRSSRAGTPAVVAGRNTGISSSEPSAPTFGRSSGWPESGRPLATPPDLFSRHTTDLRHRVRFRACAQGLVGAAGDVRAAGVVGAADVRRRRCPRSVEGFPRV